MKEWTSKEIDMVCELVGGNPEAIIRQLQSRLEELNQKVAVLQQENASLKPDAARYRWLKNKGRYNDFRVEQEKAGWVTTHSANSLDEAIDTAMQSNNQ